VTSKRALQPGDLTKYSALPWQADFNECTTQDIDITYELWNKIDPKSENDRGSGWSKRSGKRCGGRRIGLCNLMRWSQSAPTARRLISS